jgi:hypothetical protein
VIPGARWTVHDYRRKKRAGNALPGTQADEG